MLRYSQLLNLLWFPYLFIIIFTSTFFLHQKFPFYYKLVNCKVLLKVTHINVQWYSYVLYHWWYLFVHIEHSIQTICRVILYLNKTLEQQKKRSIKNIVKLFLLQSYYKIQLKTFLAQFVVNIKCFFSLEIENVYKKNYKWKTFRAKFFAVDFIFYIFQVLYCVCFENYFTLKKKKKIPVFSSI